MTYTYNRDIKRYFFDDINSEEFENFIKKTLIQIDNFIKKYKWNIKNFENPQEILSYYKDEEKISLRLNKIFHFLFYLNSLYTQNQDIMKKILEVENIFNQKQNELLFIDEEFKKIWYKKLIEFSQKNELKKYKFHLQKKAKSLKYILSNKEEKIINEYSKILSQINNLYNEYHNWLEFEIDEKKMTESEVRSLRSNKDPKTRRKAYKELRRQYWKQESKKIFTNLYSSFVKNWQIDVNIRWYKNVMEPRNFGEDMETKTVDLLIEQVKENYELFQRYVKIKSQFLWKETPLPIQDLFAPIWNSEKKISLNEAIEIHLKVMKKFDTDFYNYSVDLLKNNRVDFTTKPWKRWWAFASYSKWQESFILLNFTGKLNDVFTISHEFWHAIHGHLSQNQPDKTFDSSLSLAETASIFNEILLSEHLILDSELTKEDKIFLIEQKLSDIFATIFRQIQYTDFEKQVHNNIKNGVQYSHEDLCKQWRKTQETMTKHTIKYDTKKEDANGRSMIPHIFHTPFYCYSYAFWNILTFSLYEKFMQEWRLFIKNYKEILKSWWSIPPKELLEKYGINITTKNFYKKAFKQISFMLDQLEILTK